MISYLLAGKDLVSPQIFHRGVKMYLEGCVKKPLIMPLSGWRKYPISGRSDDYEVKFPLIHTLSNIQVNAVATEVIKELAFCDCPYFFESRHICKHIIAVCNALENEFGTKTTVDKISIKDEVLTNIFQVEFQLKTNKILQNLENYMTRAVGDLNWWESFVLESARRPSDYADFLITIKDIIHSKLREFDNEKKIAYMLVISLRIGGKFWWIFWQDMIRDFTTITQLRIWIDLWKSRQQRLTIEYEPEMLATLVNLDNETKDKMLARLQDEYEGRPKVWLDFVLCSQHTEFLTANLNKFDAGLLLQIMPLLPEKREEMEVLILAQIRAWSDYLQVGDYTELQQVLTLWKEMGKSDYFFEALKYIHSQHERKKKLMSFLNRLEE